VGRQTVASEDRSSAWAEPAADTRSWRGLDALIAFLVLTSAAKILGCLVLAIVYSPFLRAGPVPNFVYIIHITIFGGAAVFLTTAGSRDSRAVDLGRFFLLVASSFASGLAVRFTGLPSVSHQIQQALLALHPEAFLPLFLWLFVTQFPRLRRFDRGERAERIFVLAATVAGVACFVASSLSEIARGSMFSAVSAFAWGLQETWFWAILFGLAIPALPFGLWKARRADVRERRRFSVFLAGLLIGFLPIAAEVLAEAMSPSYDAFTNVPPRRLIGAFILYPLLLSIPLTTAYSVLVHRVLDVRLIVRKAVQYALARFTILALATISVVALCVSLVRHRRETIGALLTTPSVTSIVVPLAVLLAVLAARRSLLEGIDRWFFREALDTRALLGELATTSVVSGETLSAACSVFSDRLQTTLHLVQADILVADLEMGVLTSAARRLRPLPLDGRLASALAGRRDPIVVELEHPGPLVRDLPLEDQQWLADGGVHLLMPLQSGNEFMGAIALGEKLSDLPFSGEDQLLLAPVAAALALKIENLRLREGSVGARRAPEAQGQRLAEDPALVCSSCSVVSPSGADRCLRCGGSLAPTQLPVVLAGKFRLERQLGRGGMGVVYLAFDAALERHVAIKALPRVSVAESVRLRREARAMAGFAHPHLALIFGIESWRGSPALVMEYLEGGTLADRLRRSRLAPAEAARIAYDLAGAIALIHDAGLLHRDIKPSNIAFTSAGEPKLLDFGLAQMFAAGAPEERRRRTFIDAGAWMIGADLTTAGLDSFAGTPAYMAPEAVMGESLDGASDMWSFGVVLFESLTGEHPFKGPPMEADWVREIQSRAPDCPVLLGQLVADLLAADRRKRPTSAHAVRMRLREYVLSSSLEPSRLVEHI
jgi:hypothetical protein